MNIIVDRYSYSEPQAGKSAADRMAAFMKRRVRDYNDKGNDITNGQQLFKAMVDGGPELKGISVYYVSLNNPSLPSNKPKIVGIQSLYDFKFKPNKNVIAWKYYGLLVKKK